MSNLPDLFWERVHKTATCWLWIGPKDRDGYGKWKRRGAHRVAFIDAKGEIGEGMQIDHLCRVVNCVNPDHLEAVTHTENVRRGMPYWASANKTHCVNGHAFTIANTYRRPKGGRDCRACIRDRVARYNAKKRAA